MVASAAGPEAKQDVGVVRRVLDPAEDVPELLTTKRLYKVPRGPAGTNGRPGV